MRNRVILILASAGCFLSFFLLSSSLFALPGSTGRLYPLPPFEVEGALSRWLVDSGFEVSRTSPEADTVQLSASKNKENWQLWIKPQSPLATLVSGQYARNGQIDGEKLEELWTYLEGYSKNLRSQVKNINPGVPPAVLSQKEAVVCVKARARNAPLQFSGFIIDQKGLILSTAHDLEGVGEVTVILHNGQEFWGRLVKIDLHRDLALMAIQSKVDLSISLSKGRDLLAVGEKVYSILDPIHHRGRIHSGLIVGPMRLVNHQPLWQVDMEILPGSSGSPVFDTQGNIVAVVKGRFRGTETVGFLIPLGTVKEFLRETR